MNRMTATVLANFGIAGALVFAGAVEAEGNHGKVTICHATSSETNPWQELTIGYQAVYGPAGHFSEPGSPNAGHEEDYEGPCKDETTTTTPSTTPATTATTSTTTPDDDNDTTTTSSGPTTTLTDGSSSSSIVPPTSTGTPTTTPDVPTTKANPPESLNPQVAPVPAGALPETGGAVMPLAVAGALCVAVGSAIAWFNRKYR